MTLNLTFRAVGLYAFFPNLALDGLDATSSIQNVLDAVASTQPGFSYGFGPTHAGKSIVTSMTYDYSNTSRQPPNSSGIPGVGPRTIQTTIGDVSQVWQYYRSAIVHIGGFDYEIRNQTVGQPSFATTPIGSDFKVPEGGVVEAYKLVFRNVTIDLSAEKQNAYLAAKMAPTA